MWHRPKIVIVVVTFLIAGLGTTASVAAQDAKAADKATKRAFLWKATKGDRSVYLLGSVHIAKPDFYPLPKPVLDAFDEAKAVVVEADVSKVDQAKVQQTMLEKGMYPAGDGISNHLDEKDLKKLTDWAAANNVPPALFEQSRPWVLSLTILLVQTQKLGFRPDLGIDQHVIQKANEADKPVKELESVDQQLALLSGMSEEEQKAFLVSTLDDAGEMEKQLNAMIDAWKTGNAERLEHEVFKAIEKHSELKPVMTRLFDDRNVAMAKKIEGFLNEDSGPYLVVVGAGHLVGDKGLVKLLREQGMTVEQAGAEISVPAASK